LEGKEIEDAKEVKEFRAGKMGKVGDDETKVRRTSTSYDRSGCQYI
jgi:hypothetical protein